MAPRASSRRSLSFRIGFSHGLTRCCDGISCPESQGADAMSTTRRIAVLMGSHPSSRFARDIQQQTPSEAAVLAALRAQHAPSEAGRPGSPTRTHARRGRSVARRAGTRLEAGTGRAHPRGSSAAHSDRDPLSANAAAPSWREIARPRVVGSLMSRRDGRQPSRVHVEGTTRRERRHHAASAGTRVQRQPRPRSNAHCPRLRGRSANAQSPQRFRSRARATMSS